MKELIQRENYEWMVKPTPQREWIESKGVFLWLAFFFSEIGAGVYFVSLFLNSITGLIAGWLITLALGGIIHMKYLGNPERAWRMLLKPRTSELSRGLWIISLFAILGLIQIVTSFTAPETTGFSLIFKVVTGILCVLIIMHGFATMNVMRAIPSWNSSMVLPLSIASGIWVGSQLVQFPSILFASKTFNASAFENWATLLLLSYITCIILYLWGTFHSSDTAKLSITDLMKGTGVKIFYGVIFAGIVIPLLITLSMMGNEVSGGLVFLRLIFVLAGDLLLRYGLMKNAYYTPLI